MQLHCTAADSDMRPHTQSFCCTAYSRLQDSNHDVNKQLLSYNYCMTVFTAGIRNWCTSCCRTALSDKNFATAALQLLSAAYTAGIQHIYFTPNCCRTVFTA